MFKMFLRIDYVVTGRDVFFSIYVKWTGIDLSIHLTNPLKSGKPITEVQMKTAGMDFKIRTGCLSISIMFLLFYLASSPVVFWYSLFTFIVSVFFSPFAFGSAAGFCGVVVVPGLPFAGSAGVFV